MLVSLLKGDREVVTLPNLVKQKNKQTTKKKESKENFFLQKLLSFQLFFPLLSCVSR